MVRRVDTRHLAVELHGVPHGARHDALGHDLHRHLVHRLGIHEPTTRRLQTHQTAARGRDADRSTAVVGVRDGYDPGSHHGRRATRGTSHAVVQTPWIAGGPVIERFGGGGETELRKCRLAEGVEAETAPVLDESGRVLRLPTRHGAGAERGGVPGQILVVLEEGGNPGERTILCVLLFDPGHHGIEPTRRFSPGHSGLPDLRRAHTTGGQGLLEADRVEVGEGVVGEGVDAHEADATQITR